MFLRFSTLAVIALHSELDRHASNYEYILPASDRSKHCTYVALHLPCGDFDDGIFKPPSLVACNPDRPSQKTVLVIPVYIDTGVSLTILVTEKLGQSCAARDDDAITPILDVSCCSKQEGSGFSRIWVPHSLKYLLPAVVVKPEDTPSVICGFP